MRMKVFVEYDLDVRAGSLDIPRIATLIGEETHNAIGYDGLVAHNYPPGSDALSRVGPRVTVRIVYGDAVNPIRHVTTVEDPND